MVSRHAVAMPAAGRHAGQRPVATMDHGDIIITENLPENNEWQKFKGRVSLASFI